jgi:dihydrofolate synthase/folylpolyglutamate synthase
VALITSISQDHVQQLGHKLSSIAMEKAGILKPGCLALNGAVDQVAQEVIAAIAQKRGVRIRHLQRDFRYAYEACHIDSEPGHSPAHPRVQVITERRIWPTFELALIGQHQGANAALAIACVEELQVSGFHIPDRAVEQGLAQVRWPARLELLGRRPFVILDCAHNVASVEALVTTLLASFPATRRWLIFAGSSDKDLTGMLQILAPHFFHVFFTRFTTNPRSVAPEILAANLSKIAEIPVTLSSHPLEAWQAACAMASPTDLICITGSVFLAGELRPHLMAALSDRQREPGR